MRHRAPLLPIAIVLCLFAAIGCTQTDGDTVDPESKLCNSGSGFGARIDGAPEPVEMCVSDANAVTTFGDMAPDRYYIAADFTAEDGRTISVEISFVLQPLTPASLQLRTNIDAAFLDPTSVWFQYREYKDSEFDYQSVGVLGDFRVSVNDDMVAAAWFGNMTIDLEDIDGNDVGSRTISEGFVSVLPDEEL